MGKHLIFTCALAAILDFRQSKFASSAYRQSLGRIPDSVENHKYLQYRNVHNSVKRQATQFYYANLLQQYDGNVRKTWTVLN